MMMNNPNRSTDMDVDNFKAKVNRFMFKFIKSIFLMFYGEPNASLLS